MYMHTLKVHINACMLTFHDAIEGRTCSARMHGVHAMQACPIWNTYGNITGSRSLCMLISRQHWLWGKGMGLNDMHEQICILAASQLLVTSELAVCWEHHWHAQSRILSCAGNVSMGNVQLSCNCMHVTVLECATAAAIIMEWIMLLHMVRLNAWDLPCMMQEK